MRITELVFCYTRLKLNLRVFLAGHIVAMVTYCATKFTACSPMIGQLYAGYNDPSKSKSWKVLETIKARPDARSFI